MNALCDTVLLNAAGLWSCKETENGARIRTTCVFPGFEPVFVYVVRLGGGFVIHDAGETLAVMLSHGQDGAAARRIIRAECRRYDLSCEDRRISLKIDAPEWLETAIVAVANTAAAAARHATSVAERRAERDLADVLFDLLQPRLPKGVLTREYGFQGASGRRYRFDLAVQEKGRLSLIQTVRANPNSVNSRFVALADIPADEPVQKIVAHAGDLPAEDILLLQTVATVATSAGVMSLLDEVSVSR